MMTRPALQALFLGAALLTLGACEHKVDSPPAVVEAPLPTPPMGTLASQTYAAVDTMLNSAPADLPSGTIVLVASLASIDNLEESSRFGRVIAEQVGSRLVQRGLVVREVKLGSTLMVKEKDGEFMLSRKLREIRGAQDAAVVVTGTYGMAFSNMFVNLRITRLQDGAVLGATDFQVARDLDVRRMTADSADARPGTPAPARPQQMRRTP
jgi:TolB-like protein